MRKKLERWLYYRLARLSIKTKWVRNKSVKLTKTQDMVLKITMASILDEDSELLTNPMIEQSIGEKYYIKKFDSEGTVEKFITIAKTSMGYSISLIGKEIMDGVRHDYHFDIWFEDSSGQLIVDRFKRVVKRRRDKMEADIRKDDERALDLILKRLEKKNSINSF